MGELENDIAFDQAFQDGYKPSRDPAVLKLLKKEQLSIPIYNIDAKRYEKKNRLIDSTLRHF